MHENRFKTLKLTTCGIQTYLFEWMPAGSRVVRVWWILQFLKSIDNEMVVSVLEPLLLWRLYWLARDLL